MSFVPYGSSPGAGEHWSYQSLPDVVGNRDNEQTLRLCVLQLVPSALVAQVETP